MKTLYFFPKDTLIFPNVDNYNTNWTYKPHFVSLENRKQFGMVSMLKWGLNTYNLLNGSLR